MVSQFKAYWFILVLGTFTASWTHAQSDSVYTHHIFAVNAGFNQIKEEILHRKVHQGFIVGINYSRERFHQDFNTIQLELYYSPLKTKFESNSHSLNIQFKGSIQKIYQIQKLKSISFFAGPQLSANYNLSYYTKWDDGHLYWADHLSLGISSRTIFEIHSSRSIYLNFSLSTLSIFSRPEDYREYKIDDVSLSGVLSNMNSNIEFGTLNKTLNLSAECEYNYAIIGKIRQAISYQFCFSYLNSRMSLPFKNIQHQFKFKLYI